MLLNKINAEYNNLGCDTVQPGRSLSACCLMSASWTYSSTLKVEVVSSIEASVRYQTKRCHFLEDDNLHGRRREYFKFHKLSQLMASKRIYLGTILKIAYPPTPSFLSAWCSYISWRRRI